MSNAERREARLRNALHTLKLAKELPFRQHLEQMSKVFAQLHAEEGNDDDDRDYWSTAYSVVEDAANSLRIDMDGQEETELDSDNIELERVMELAGVRGRATKKDKAKVKKMAGKQIRDALDETNEQSKTAGLGHTETAKKKR